MSPSEVSSRQVAVDGERWRAQGSSGYTRASYRIALAGVAILKHVPSTNQQCICYLACHFNKICDKSDLGEGEFILSQFKGHSVWWEREWGEEETYTGRHGSQVCVWGPPDIRNRETGTIWDRATTFKGSISNTFQNFPLGTWVCKETFHS